MKRMLPLLAMLLVAATPKPKPLPMPPVELPNKPLHVSLEVEVNDRGQVVRVAHGTLSGDRAFDTMTLGNAMQMWIRHPNGRAEAGLYRVQYAYDPKTKHVKRVPSLIKRGGSWAKKPGAATLIVGDLQAQAQRAYARLHAEQRHHREAELRHLPDINAAIKRSRSRVKPTPKP